MEKIGRQFRFRILKIFFGQFGHPIGGNGMGEWDEGKRVDGSYRYSSQLIREHENLV